MKLIPVSPENVHLAWKDVGKYAGEALVYADDKYTVADVHEMLANGLLTLWVVYNDEKDKAVGCLLTEIIEHPRMRVLSIFLAGGEFSNMILVLDDLKDYALSAKCKNIEFYGRPGWEKTLKPWGFDKIHTVMRLKL